MSERKSITFYVPLPLKETFKQVSEEHHGDMTKALELLMKAYIKDPTITTISRTNLEQEIESKYEKLLSQSEKKLDERMEKFDILIAKAGKQLQIKVEESAKSLNEELLVILKTDSEVKKSSYVEIENSIIKQFPHLKEEILEKKKLGNNPIHAVITELRKSGIVKQNKRTKSLTWVK